MREAPKEGGFGRDPRPDPPGRPAFGYRCDYRCGFKGDFKAVADHERVCKKGPLIGARMTKKPKRHAAEALSAPTVPPAPAAVPAEVPPNDGGWVGWLAKLKAYKRRHGDCNVPLH